MGKPVLNQIRTLPAFGRRDQLGEVKHLSSRRKRKHRDSLSSGERKGKSLNSFVCQASMCYTKRVVGSRVDLMLISPASQKNYI
jgi:hypothetical protein